jgi:soluble lytic murein transglycosylase-like protein
MLGSKLVLLGSFVGAITLSLFLYTISAGSAYSSVIDATTTAHSNLDALPIQAVMVDQNADTTNLSSSPGDCQINPNYPETILQWCGLITDYAEQRGLEPNLIAALIWQESGGKPQAYSSSGAVGLMQIMPSDGLAASFQCINGPCFSNRPTITELEDPEFNIAYGTKMLAGLQARTGNLREALKSYGPMNVGYSYADKVIGIFNRYGAQ